MIKELRRNYPQANIIAVDYDPGASEVNQLNRIKLMLSVAMQGANAGDGLKHSQGGMICQRIPEGVLESRSLLMKS